MTDDIDPERASELTAILEVVGRLTWDGADEARFVAAVREAVGSFAPGMIAGVPGERERRALSGSLAFALWHATPQRGLNWRCPQARMPGRNDPCLCGSGQKSKKCCGDTAPPLEAFTQMNMLRYVLDAVPTGQLNQVDVLRMQPEAVGDTARQWLEEEQHSRVAALLAPVFENVNKLDGRYTECFEHLMGAWLAQGDLQNRQRLLDSLEAHADRLLAGTALQFRAMIAADCGQWDEAWAMFEAAKRKNLDEPVIALLEMTLLLGQGRDATARAQWWAERLMSISPDYQDLAEHLLGLAEDNLPDIDSPTVNTPIDATSIEPGSLEADSLRQALSEAIQSQQFNDLQEAQDFAGNFTMQRNRQPVDAFAGLTPEQMHHLLNMPFDSPDFVEFAQTVPGSGSAPIMRWYGALARSLAEQGAKRTATGNLPRALSREIALQVWGDAQYQRLQKILKIASETDVGELHVTRLVAGLAGLTRAYKGRLVLTRLGQRLLTDEGEAQVYALLLKAFALKFNWGYRDRYEPLQIIQRSFAFTLYLLQQHADEPARMDTDYARDFITAFPAATHEVDAGYGRTPEQTVRRCYELRSLKRFAGLFGLIKPDADLFGSIDPQPVEVLPLIHSVLRFK